MRKLRPLWFSSLLLLGVSATPGQEKKPPTTLEEDWKTLCRFQWVNSDPKEAWAQFDEEWKKSRARRGVKGWSKIELAFKDGRPDKKEYRMTVIWYYQDADGKEKTDVALDGVMTDLHEEKGDRFLLRGKAKIKYELKEGVLILSGVEDWGKNAAPFVYTGKYKGVERKDKK
jgi:hypothetical protein